MFTLYSLTSDLHSETPLTASQEAFIKSVEKAVGAPFTHKDSDFSSYDKTENNIIYVRTGGTEGIFKSIFHPDGRPIRLLTSGKSNSLAASMEILSYLNQRGYPAEILHGNAEEIARRLIAGFTPVTSSHTRDYDFGKVLEGKRVGVIGRPSDWLISSDVDYSVAKERLGVELVDVSIEELENCARTPDRKYLDGLNLAPLNAPKYGSELTQSTLGQALDIYCALKELVAKYSLDGLSLRCFDLLTSLHNTGCLALALLNSEGIVATCEGDVPTLLTMCVAREKFGTPGFQANLSEIDGSRMLFAHCTVPLNLTESYCFDTHFESGIGIAIHGTLPTGPAKILKISPDCSKMFFEDIHITDNPYGDNLCRTQIYVDAPGLADYFLREPIGNHHVIIPHHVI